MARIPVTVPVMDAINKEERTWALIAHLSAFAMYLTAVGHILGPLIIWLAKRDGNSFVDDQAKEALNFQITFSIFVLVAVLLCFTIVGIVIAIPAFIVLPTYHVVCMIIAAVKAYDGVPFRYPLTIRLVK